MATPSETEGLAAIAQAQERGAVAAYVDCAHTLDLLDARQLGVDCSRMLLSQPDTGEQAMDVVEALVRSGRVGIVVVNPATALVDPSGDPGLDARTLHRRVHWLQGLANKLRTTLLLFWPEACKGPRLGDDNG